MAWHDGQGGGLIVSKEDQSSGATWGCRGVIIGTNEGYGSGPSNTAAIIEGCDEQNIAARKANNYVKDDYNDWFLPSKDELNLAWCVLGSNGTEDRWEDQCSEYIDIEDHPGENLAGFSHGDNLNERYWSSSEVSSDRAERIQIRTGWWGYVYYRVKNSEHSVRAVRFFND